MLNIFLRFQILTSSKNIAELARKCEISDNTFRNMVSDGSRLLYLSLCGKLILFVLLLYFINFDLIGSPYILLLFALFNQKREICKDATTKDISALGTYLRRVPSMCFIYLYDIK